MQTSLQQNRTFIPDIYHTDDLQDWVSLFLHASRYRNLVARTIEVHIKKLNAFIAFCSAIAITDVSQITPDTIRHFLIVLEEGNHKPAGIHCYARSVKGGLGEQGLAFAFTVSGDEALKVSGSTLIYMANYPMSTCDGDNNPNCVITEESPAEYPQIEKRYLEFHYSIEIEDIGGRIE